MRRVFVPILFLLTAITVRPIAAQQSKLPPVSYICTMAGDEDVIEDKPGRCPKCGMELQGVRLDTVYTCLTNTSIVKDRPGTCPTDGRPLVPMTMSLSFVCPNAPDVKESINPGTCPDGTAKQRKYSPRAHGNHNPQHGGAFFMAPDNWHHLEGAYYANGTFRLYLYDDFTKPLAAAQVRATKARLILPNENKEVPLVRNGRFLEAKLGKQPFPLSLQAKVQFQEAAPEHHFDFTFEKFSVDVPVPAATTTTTPPPAPPGAATAPVPTPAPSANPSVVAIAPSTESAIASTPIPETVPEMLEQLNARNDQIKAFIDRGSFASVYVPAFQAKDVALALDAKKSELAPEKQRRLSPAVDRLVKSAYLLDAFGDLGNKQQIVEAYARFASAVDEIKTAFQR